MGFGLQRMGSYYGHLSRNGQEVNLVTKQVDIDIYYDLGGKMEVKNIDGVIDIKIPRMEEKNEALVTFAKDKKGMKYGKMPQS